MTIVAGELWLFVGLFSCWILVFVFWMDYRVDALREELFALRGELFDFAAEGNIDFRSPAYCRLWHLINALIRFAHKLNFPRLLLGLAIRTAYEKSGGRNFMKEWTADIEETSPEVRERLVNIHYRLAQVYLKHILGGSLFLRTAKVGVKLGLFTTHKATKERLAKVVEEQALENDELQPAYA